jgi:hypothetical protein
MENIFLLHVLAPQTLFAPIVDPTVTTSNIHILFHHVLIPVILYVKTAALVHMESTKSLHVLRVMIILSVPSVQNAPLFITDLLFLVFVYFAQDVLTLTHLMLVALEQVIQFASTRPNVIMPMVFLTTCIKGM